LNPFFLDKCIELIRGICLNLLIQCLNRPQSHYPQPPQHLNFPPLRTTRDHFAKPHTNAHRVDLKGRGVGIQVNGFRRGGRALSSFNIRHVMTLVNRTHQRYVSLPLNRPSGEYPTQIPDPGALLQPRGLRSPLGGRTKHLTR